MDSLSSLAYSRWIPDSRCNSLDRVPDELWVDVGEEDTEDLECPTWYGQAVLGCRLIEDTYMLLKVRPDMRDLLHAQLRSTSNVSYVYRTGADGQRRVILTRMLFISFVPEATEEERRSCLGGRLRDLGDKKDLHGGVYTFLGEDDDDMLSAWKEIQTYPVVREASPVVMDIFPGAAVEAGAAAIRVP